MAWPAEDAGCCAAVGTCRPSVAVPAFCSAVENAVEVEVDGVAAGAGAAAAGAAKSDCS